MVAIGWLSDGGRRLQRSGVGDLTSCWRRVATGGGDLLAGSPATANKASRPLIATGKNTEMKRRTRGNHLGAQKGGRSAGGADQRRGAELRWWRSGGGAVEERKSSGERCGLKRELGASYIGPRGERRGRG
jgi:hypothetical protein